MSESDDELLELAVQLETKKSASDQLSFLVENLTWRSGWAALWRIAARGLLTPELLAGQLGNLAADVTNASPDEIVGVLSNVPKHWSGAGIRAWLLEDYPLALDALVMHAAHRAPEAFAALAEKLPANVRRALPFVRRRLGIEAPLRSPELFSSLVKAHVQSTGSGELWMLRDGVLVPEPLERLEQVMELAALVAPGESLEAAIVAAVPSGELPPHEMWRLLPFYASAPAERFFSMFERTYYYPDQILPVLARRQDPPELLFTLLRREQAKDGNILDWLANAIARRLHEIGQPVPRELDAEVTFRSTPRRYEDPAWDVYVNGLRAFPRERLLARVDALLASENEDERDAAVTGLRAYPDEERLRRVARDAERVRVLGGVGPVAIPFLCEALEEAEDEQAFLLRYSLTGALVGAPVIEEAWDDLLATESQLFSLVFASLPLERRDRWVRKHLDERAAAIVHFLHLLGDDALGEALGKIVALEKLPDLRHALGRLGVRATRPLVRHLTGASPARVLEVVNQSRLPDEVADRLLGNQRPKRLPIVSGSIVDGPRYLSLVSPHLLAARTAAHLKLTGDRIAIGDYDTEHRRVLDRRVPAGKHPVTLHYKDGDFSAYPTAGLEAILIRFRDATPTTWVEANDDEGPALGGDEFSFWLGDEERIAEQPDAAATAIEEAGEDCYTDGLALAELDGDTEDESGALVIYIGECCRTTRAFWGFADGDPEDATPAALVAAFQYVVGG
jgi:hypothetical protein